jgi:hypothetical protein
MSTIQLYFTSPLTQSQSFTEHLPEFNDMILSLQQVYDQIVSGIADLPAPPSDQFLVWGNDGGPFGAVEKYSAMADVRQWRGVPFGADVAHFAAQHVVRAAARRKALYLASGLPAVRRALSALRTLVGQAVSETFDPNISWSLREVASGLGVSPQDGAISIRNLLSTLSLEDAAADFCTPSIIELSELSFFQADSAYSSDPQHRFDATVPTVDIELNGNMEFAALRQFLRLVLSAFPVLVTYRLVYLAPNGSRMSVGDVQQQ